MVDRVRREFLKLPVTKEKSVTPRELNQTVSLYKTVVTLLKIFSMVSNHTESHLLTIILIPCTCV